MRYLVDGYNLLYALGLAHKAGGRAAWDHSRTILLDWLADQHGPTAADVTVVFDAQNAAGGRIEERHRGLRVVRHGGRAADDVIEEFVRSERSPETLTVVSNDHRIRDAAVGCRVGVRGCGEYVDSLLNQLGPPPFAGRPADDEEKDAEMTPEELQHWLREFDGT